jgi:hypothetical protein
MPVPARAKGQGDGLSFDVGFASAEWCFCCTGGRRDSTLSSTWRSEQSPTTRTVQQSSSRVGRTWPSELWGHVSDDWRQSRYSWPTR